MAIKDIRVLSLNIIQCKRHILNLYFTGHKMENMDVKGLIFLLGWFEGP